MSVFKAWSRTLAQTFEIFELISSPDPTGQWFRALVFSQYEDILDNMALGNALESASGVWTSSRELLTTWADNSQEINLTGLISLLNDIDTLLITASTIDQHLDPELPGQLLGGILANTLVSKHPLVGFLAMLLGLIETNTYDTPAIISSKASRGFFPLGADASFKLDALASLLQNPKRHMVDVLNRAHRRVDALVTMERLLAPVLAESFGRMGWKISTIPALPLPKDVIFDELEVGKWAYSLESANVDGTVVSLAMGLCRKFASYGIALQLASDLRKNFKSEHFIFEVDLTKTPAVLALGSFGVLFESSSSHFSNLFTLKPTANAYTPLSFGIDNVFKLVFNDPTLRIGVDGPSVDALHAEISSRLALTLGSAESDSFLSSLLSSFSDAPVEAGVALAWNSRQGFHLKGSGDFSLKLPLHLPESSPVKLLGVEIGLRLPNEEESLVIEVSASISAKLGPIALVVERTGLCVAFDTTMDGPVGAKLRADILPPRGVGMSIDTAVVSGGGYLFFNWEKAEYGGAVALNMGSISLRALGLITTRLPRGQQGFSMIVVITADFKPVQLGLGFTLNGVGGLFGVNRTIEIELLCQGLKEGVLDAVLLSDGGTPEEFIARAPELLSTLGDVFPVAQGQFLFGPIITIGWGTPTLISARLGVIVELPKPLRMLLVGTVMVQLPLPKVPVVDLRMDVLGVFEPTEKRASLDATLFDSRIGPYSVSGDMAFRMSWGNSPSFLLSIGGFHPAFEAPPGLTTLKRLSLSLGKGSNPRLALEAYLALTSNTVQMGARLGLYASKLGFAISGSLGFDTLLYLEPFALQVDLYAKLALIRVKSGSKLMSVDVSASLTGPGPWRVAGLAEFTFLGMAQEVNFSKTFGTQVESEPPRVEVWPLLEQAIAEPISWASQLPSDFASNMGVTLEARDVPEASLLVHPTSALEMRQQILPLGMQLERFGVAIPREGDQYFEISKVKLGRQDADFAQTISHFAPGEFLELTEQEKLSRPSFEPMPSGITLRSTQDDVTLGASRAVSVGYEQLVIDESYAAPVSDQGLILNWDKTLALNTLGHSARARPYQEPELGVVWQDNLYVIVNTSTLEVDPAFTGIQDTYTKQAQRLDALPSSQKRDLEIVLAHEAA